MASSVDNSMATHNNISMLQVSPNPVASSFVIHYNYAGAQKVNAVLYNANGKAVWSSGLLNADALNGRQVNVAAFGNGIYYLKATTEKGDATVSTKVIVSK